MPLSASELAAMLGDDEPPEQPRPQNLSGGRSRRQPEQPQSRRQTEQPVRPPQQPARRPASQVQKPVSQPVVQPQPVSQPSPQSHPQSSSPIDAELNSAFESLSNLGAAFAVGEDLEEPFENIEPGAYDYDDSLAEYDAEYDTAEPAALQQPAATPEVLPQQTPAQMQPVPVQPLSPVQPSPQTSRPVEPQSGGLNDFLQNRGRVVSDPVLEKEKKKVARKSGEGDFTDFKKGRLKPFGGKRKQKASEFDKRKNLQTQAAIVKWSIIAGIFALVAFSAKTAIVPPPGLKAADVSTLITQQTNSTGFPSEAGGAYAKLFLENYLTGDAKTTGGSESMPYVNDDGDVVPREYQKTSEYLHNPDSVGPAATVRVVSPPEIFKRVPLAEYSEGYQILLKVRTEPDSKELAPMDKNGNPYLPQEYWVMYYVGVYYNEIADSFTIPLPPSPMPLPDFNDASNAPKQKPPSDIPEASADKELKKAMEPLVKGFIKAYFSTTPDDNEAIKQFLSKDASVRLLRGLGGIYKVKSVDFDAFETGIPDKPYSALVTVRYAMDTATNKGAITDTKESSLVLFMKKSGDKYLVASVAPAAFQPTPKSVAEYNAKTQATVSENIPEPLVTEEKK